MSKRQEIQKIGSEAERLAGSTHQMVSGDLDIAISTENYVMLSDLAEDINQISKSFNEYINEIAHILSHLSAGNMAVSFTKNINYQGDFVPIKNALHKIRHSLNSSFEEINQLTVQVDKLSSQVDSGAAQIAKNASDQANLITDLTGKIYQITEHTTNNARNAKLAAESVNEVQKEAETGGKYMEQMLGSIEKVQSSSRDISGIITIISGLAEQTKLLALNAAIEAARAGESGRGFSVVASEVRNLAERSAEAVNQTTQLIDNSLKTAKESAEIADKTSESFQKINSSIENVTKLCTDIAEVSESQAESLKNTSVIITDISNTIQNDAAYAQENSAVASNLLEVSSSLKKVMTKYRLRNQKNSAVIVNNSFDKIDKSYLQNLFDKLAKASMTNEIDAVLEAAIKNQKDFECLYVIDGKGSQQSHTVMNPEITIEQDENFKPAMPGDYCGEKKYFRKAMKKPHEWYTSIEYISTATGGLCRTVSCSYEGEDGKTYVICIDLISRFS
jgi:Methyl-accepting chemotaxis protein